MLTKGTSRFSNSFSWTSAKCSLHKHTAWHYSELGMNFPSIHALLLCLRRKPGQYANSHATPIKFLICKKNAWVSKLEKQEITFLVTKRTIYSSHADSWMLREVKILFQSVVQVITVPEWRHFSSYFFSARSQHCVSSKWISIRVWSN